MKNPELMRGISFLEILIAFGILSIMLGVTLPDPTSHLIRTKVERSLETAAMAQTALQRTCQLNSRAVVKTHGDAGFEYAPPREQEDFVAQLLLGADCAHDEMVVVLWTRNTGAKTDPVLKLTAYAPVATGPGTPATGFAWRCTLVEGTAWHAPATCRTAAGAG